MTTERRPALMKTHPLRALGASAETVAGSGEEAPRTPSPPLAGTAKKATEQLNLRLDQELCQRVERGALTLGAQRGQRVPKVALVEQALREFLDRNGL